jgi:serine/threonine-protein kinase
VADILRKVQRDEIPPPRQINRRVPRAMEAVVRKAMALRPADRYASVRSLAADIDHWLAGEPVSAWREPWAVRVRRWIRRHQTAATAVAAAIVVAAAGLMAVSIVQAEANRGLRDANSRLTDSLSREARANEALSAANVRERASREQAQRRFGLARQAIEQYYTGASEDVLLKQPELEALRTKLLSTALGFYKRLQAELEGSDDPATRSELAAAYMRVGEITDQVGQAGEALGAYERARAIREALVRADPSADGPRRDLSLSLESTGLLLTGTSGRTIEGLRRLESALALRQALTVRRPAEADDRLSIARIHRYISGSQRVAGRPSGELRSLEQARDVAERLLADRPGRAAARQELAKIYRYLGYTYLNQGQTDLSSRSMDRALALQEQLAAEHPADPGYLQGLGDTLEFAGIILRNGKRPAESLPYRRRALEVFRRLEADYPAHTRYRYSVARNHLLIGVSLVDLGRMAEALKDLEQAAAIFERLAAEHPGFNDYPLYLAYTQMNLAKAHGALGRPAAARRALERAHSIYERQPPRAVAVFTVYNMACTESLLSALAVGSERDAYAVRAIATLRRAFAAGYRNLNTFRTDTDLDPLRSRPDFQLLMMDLTMPDDPFARPD